MVLKLGVLGQKPYKGGGAKRSPSRLHKHLIKSSSHKNLMKGLNERTEYADAVF